MATKTTNSNSRLGIKVPAKQGSYSPITMEELLASQSQKLTILFRGKEVEGEIVNITDKELILDLGTKSEGVLPAHGIPAEKLKDLKIGDKVKAFVCLQENENGQTLLSYEKQSPVRFERNGSRRGGHSRGDRSLDWSKFIQAQKQKSKLQGKVLEVNKGGLIVEAAGVRGFLPNSQVGFELLSKSGQGMDSLIGQDLTVTVIEVDSDNNKLIFSQRGQVSEEVKEQLKKFKAGQKVTGKIVVILPFGLVVSVDGPARQSPDGSSRMAGGVEGLVFIADVSWEKVEDLSQIFTVGQEVEVLVSSIDGELGRLNLSIKGLIEDPFAKLAEKFPVDEVVKGEITEVAGAGVVVALDGIEGFLPASKMSPDGSYEVGKSMSFLVDSVDPARRRINLAPFVTSTAGLIYK